MKKVILRSTVVFFFGLASLVNFSAMSQTLVFDAGDGLLGGGGKKKGATFASLCGGNPCTKCDCMSSSSSCTC